MPRKKLLFTNDWKFHFGPCPMGASPELDDSSWKTVSLPDDFQMSLPWIQDGDPGRGFKPMCEGWYRKKLSRDPGWEGKKVLLDLEGIMLRGKLYCEGEEVGATHYGYLGFEADITRFFADKEEVTLAVYCSSGNVENSRWYTGCGINRDVHLIVKDPLSFARHPLFIRTLEADEKKALLGLSAMVEGLQEDFTYDAIINIDTIKYACKPLPEMELLAEIYSPSGEKLTEARLPFPKRSRRKAEELSFDPIPLENPRLWSCEEPVLYTVKVSLFVEGRLRDKVETRFGIRTLAFTREQGLLLNGKKVFLQGSSCHHDFLGAAGATCGRKEFERLFDLLKSFGFNHIRCAHNPCPPVFYDVADEKGFLITDELYDGWAKEWAGGEVPWMLLWQNDIPEWVKRDRNHPSIVLWSLGNEIQMREDRCEFPGNDWCVTGYKVLSTLLKRYDETRPTTVACFPARANGINRFDPEFKEKVIPPELAQVGEVASFNYFPDAYKEYLKHSPHMIVYQSEANIRHLSIPFVLMDREKMMGLSYWGCVDYWGESPGYPYKGWNYSFFDHTLEPYPQAYLVGSLFREELSVHIGVADEENLQCSREGLLTSWKSFSSHWKRKEGAFYTIAVYSNGEKAELFLNGRSLGEKANDPAMPNFFLWEKVSYEKGTLTAVATGKDGAKKEFSLTTPGEPSRLRLLPETDTWKADGRDRLYVRIHAVDKKGDRSPSSAPIRVTLSGNGRLWALDHGDHTTNALFNTGEITLHNGSALAILEAGTLPGEILMEVKSPDLAPASLVLKTE